MNTLKAQGLADLELWEDASAALDELSPADQSSPAAIRLRLDCAIGLERWNAVRELAGHLSRGSDEDRRAAATAFRVLAGVAVRSRQIEAAGELVRLTIEAWPDARRDVMDDPELSELLR